MNSLFINAIKDAFNNASTVFTAAGLPPVAHIDKYRSQPLNPEQHEGFELPAIFYNMRASWDKQGKLYKATMILEFHVVQDATWETSSVSENQLDGLQQLTFLNFVRQVLDTVTSSCTSKLTRTEDTPVDVGVTVYDILGYTGAYYEQQAIGSTISTSTNVTPEMELKGTIKTHL